MTERTKKILRAIVKEYILKAEPVGSKVLVNKYNLRVSPATIRTEMKLLEMEGYISQPHTSAGRVPTNKGYRLYVDSLMPGKDLSQEQQKKIQTEFLKLQSRYNQLSRATAKLLSLMTHNLAISGLIKEGELADSGIVELLKQPEFSDTKQVCQVAEALDWLNENVDEIVSDKSDAIEVYIGDENPTKHLINCSMVVAHYQLPSGEKGFMAVVGPKRMRYSRTIPLIDFLSNYLTERNN